MNNTEQKNSNIVSELWYILIHIVTVYQLKKMFITNIYLHIVASIRTAVDMGFLNWNLLMAFLKFYPENTKML